MYVILNNSIFTKKYVPILLTPQLIFKIIENIVIHENLHDSTLVQSLMANKKASRNQFLNITFGWVA